jgi:hypothetical protein
MDNGKRPSITIPLLWVANACTPAGASAARSAMSRLGALTAAALFCCAFYLPGATAQDAKPGSPLICHKEVCATAPGPCQVLASPSCVHGGGPPSCPAIINAPDGTACNTGNLCMVNDVCSAGACTGTPLVCSSPTDTCSPATGLCATPCDANGCVVSAAGGTGNPTLTVPPGALSSPVSISMVDQGGDPNDASVFHVYKFGPSGTTFATPATVDLPAPPLSAGQTPVIEVSDDGTTWVGIATTLNSGRVNGPISHFSFCRTRANTGASTLDLIVTDMVNYQELVNTGLGTLVIPPPGDAGSCYSGDIFGVS